jgi:prepilin peptidase CpaA
VPNLITIALLIVLALAVSKDTQAQRIPNWLTGAGALTGLVLQAMSGGMSAALVSLGGLALGIALLLPFYALRGMGAGDVKLMGAVGSFVGMKAVVLAAGTTLIIGAVLGLALVACRILSRSGFGLKRAAAPFSPTSSQSAASIRKEKFPYAIAIAGGSVVALADLGSLHTLAGFILGWSAT